jgi:ribosome biogenesis GTPase
MRELHLWDANEAVLDTFDDVLALAPECRFRDCRHDQEPGCAVRAAVEAGTFDAARLEGFLKLVREREALDDRRDERERAVKRDGRIGSKAMKQLQRTRDR